MKFEYLGSVVLNGMEMGHKMANGVLLLYRKGFTYTLFFNPRSLKASDYVKRNVVVVNSMYPFLLHWVKGHVRDPSSKSVYLCKVSSFYV